MTNNLPICWSFSKITKITAFWKKFENFLDLQILKKNLVTGKVIFF